MKFVTLILYALKANVLQVLVNNSRSHSISIQFIDSSIFEASASTSHCDEHPDYSYMVNNMTGCPII